MSDGFDPDDIIPLLAITATGLVMFEPSHSTLLAIGGAGLSLGGGLAAQYAVRSDFGDRIGLEGP